MCVKCKPDHGWELNGKGENCLKTFSIISIPGLENDTAMATVIWFEAKMFRDSEAGEAKEEFVVF